MSRRSILPAVAAATAGLAVAVHLLVDQGGSASAAPAAADVRQVSSADELQAALASARPGQVIAMADGIYAGRFLLSVSGTAANPIVLRGGPGAVLDSQSPSSGITVHLQNADHWRLEGFSVRSGQKGVVLDNSNHNVLSGLDVGLTGMEAVHFRSSSSDNRLEGSDVHDAGRVNAGFGEGVYVGSAKSNWGEYGNSGGVDRSDRNVITGNRIHAVTAENIDIKEGTTGGEISGNVLVGDGMTGAHYADSLVDLKGNEWLVANNTGTKAVLDGIQTHVQLLGWGQGNVIRGNTLAIDSAGYGINIQGGDAASGNRIGCDNQVSGAAGGTANVPCR
jgi:hypothetical protein